jgi:hypothetical protein
MTDRPNRRLRRRWPRRVAAATFTAVALFASVVGYVRWRDWYAWHSACVEADRLDPGWRWADLQAARAAVPEGENSAPLILAAARLIPADWPVWVSVVRDEDVPPPAPPNPLDEEFGITPDPPTFEDRRHSTAFDLEFSLDGLTPVQRLTPRQAGALERLLAQAESALAVARGLESRPHGRFRLDGPPLDSRDRINSTSAARSVARLLAWQAERLAYGGDLDGALACCRAAVNTARPAADEPGVNHALVANAIRIQVCWRIRRVVGQGKPGTPALAETQLRLEAEMPRPDLLTAARGNRAELAETVRAIDEGRFPADSFSKSLRLFRRPAEVTGYPPLDDLLDHLRGGGWRKRYEADWLRYQTAVVELLKRRPDGPPRGDAAWLECRSRLPSVLEDVARADELIAESHQRTQAHLRCTVVALAAERFRRDAGRWPGELTELVPKYLAMVPADPFDGKPLRFRAHLDGIEVHSIGTETTIAKSTTEESEVVTVNCGTRLWDPAHRGQAQEP